MQRQVSLRLPLILVRCEIEVLNSHLIRILISDSSNGCLNLILRRTRIKLPPLLVMMHRSALVETEPCRLVRRLVRITYLKWKESINMMERFQNHNTISVYVQAMSSGRMWMAMALSMTTIGWSWDRLIRISPADGIIPSGIKDFR